MGEYYFIIKAVHVIFMVSYFAGLFYIIRLFIYHTEANGKKHADVLKEQFLIMETKLWNIIIVPAGLIMALSGMLLLYKNPFLFQTTWMHVKLAFVILLLVFHVWTWITFKKLKRNIFPYTSARLRLANEAPTLILFVVVFAVILKGYFLQLWYWVFITFILIGVIIMTIVKLTNRKK